MIKHALSLCIALFLAAGPAAAQVQEAANAGKGGQLNTAGAAAASQGLNAALPGLPGGVPGLTGALTGGAVPIIAFLEAADVRPESLRALAANPTVAGGYVRALIAAPVAPAVRAEAVRALGEPEIARLEAAVEAFSERTAGSAQASAALKTVAAEFAALGERAPQPFAVAASPAPASKPAKLAAPGRAWNALKRATVGAMMAVTLTMSVAGPALAQQSLILPNVPATTMMAQIGAQQQQVQVVQAADINDAIAKWTPATKVIVIGNPGLDAGSQRQLAAWLEGKHWTVIIVQSNAGMTYRDAEGRTHRDNDAVEYGAGQGIFKKDGFSSRINTETGLSDGSILVITMEQRKLFLRNSEAQRVNGLDGEREFPGNLDQWAKARLRAGGDIMGAAKETVTNIDARLHTSIASASQNAKSSVASAKTSLEELARTRAAFARAHPAAAATVGAVDLAGLGRQLASAEKALAGKSHAEAARLAAAVTSSARSASSSMSSYQSSYDSGKSMIASVRAEVDALERASGSFLKAHPKATGDLARPDLRALRERLASAESAVASNPSGAKSAADSVAAEVRRVQTALNEHAAGADQLAGSESVLSELEGRERAGSAATDLVTAKQSLREAREAHELGASTWASRLQSAKSALANAERTIADADAAASRNAMLTLIFLVLLGLGTLGGSAFLNWRARKARGKAEAELQKWDGILETKLDAVIDELDKRMDVYVGPITGAASRGWEEETAAAASSVRKDAGRAKLYLAMARSIHDRATALVRPKAMTLGWLVNQLWPSRYLQAEKMLATEPLTFKPEDGFDALFEKASDWRGDLYGEAKDYAPVSENFESVMAKFNATSKSAVSALDEIEKASTGYGAAFDATEAAIAAAEKKASQAAAGAFFKIEALAAAILPQARETLAAARGKAAKNPVGAMKGQGALAERLASDAKSLAELALSMRKDELAVTDPIVAALAAASVGTQWIAGSRAALDKSASELASSLLKNDGALGLAALTAAYAEHTTNLAKAKNGLGRIAASRADAVKSAAAVDAARARTASVLGLEASEVLREAQNDPTERLTAASVALDEASSKLGDGRLAEAEASQKLGADLIGQANAIVAATDMALKEQASDVAGRIAEAERLDALLPERAEVLKTIKRDFAASVLGLASGDFSHPNANGTIEDNIDEASVAVEAAKSKREKAVRSFREAKVLEAAALLDQAKAHEEIAQGRLDEISAKRARLDKAVIDNGAFLETLEAKARAWKTEIPDDKRTMRDTIKSYETSVKALSSARAAADMKKGDPFKAAASIAAVSAGLDSLWVKVNNDRDAYNEVVRSLKAAETQLDSAARLARDSQSDGISDSPAITSALRELAGLKSAYTSALAASDASHGEWPTIDREADRITSQAAQVAASLKGELAAAARATEKISSAASKVREATNWTGSYGVSVPGSPGSGNLNSAKASLNNGDYETAIRHAEAARSAAISAIQVAEAEVSRRRREEEEERRRQEEARRRRQQEEDDRRRRSEEDSRRSSGGSSGGGSSWGGSSSGGGSSGW
ncbi:MAG: hypothetical protein Q8T11_09510 [Elusimicrobiota bacterium]|nr:hypothetical protein [Elusimicrobiota bacterium]